MQKTNRSARPIATRSVATVAAWLAIGAALSLAGCTAPVTPAVSFPTEKLTISLESMTVGTPVSETLPPAMGGKEGLVYTLTPDVPGLTFDPATRVLSGTPTTPGTYAMTYTAKDPATDGTMESVKFTIAVAAPTPPPTLLGTWERVTTDRDDSGAIVRTETFTLMFTETHYFEWGKTLDADGRVLDSGDGAGKVSLSDTSNTVTKTYDDDGEVFSVDKEYLYAGDGDVLVIHEWGSDNPAEERFDRFTRVADAPTPIGPPKLQGTWRQTHAWDDEDEGSVIHIRTLTFFGTRFIEHNVRRDSLSNELLFEYAEPGGWTDTGTSVIKMVSEDDRMLTVEKHYVLAGDVLAINPWWNNEDSFTELDLGVFTRVQDPVAGGIEGVWTRVEDHGGWAYTLTVGDRLTYDEGDVDTEASARTGFTLAGPSRHDRDRGFLFVTVQTAARTEDGSPDEGFDPAEFVGHELRFAYAPTNLPDKIFLSPYVSELEYDATTSTWKAREVSPYGDYWLSMERQ